MGSLLLGFTDVPHLKVPLFLVFFSIYTTTLIGNIGMILLIRIVTSLHTPMYFFLSHLSFVDSCYASSTAPKMLLSFLEETPSISLSGCAAQMYFYVAFGSVECFLLAAMAIDRYVAICYPLIYYVIMRTSTCARLLAGSYFIGFFYSVYYVASIFRLPFCKSRMIRHFFCEIPPLLKLSCVDTRRIELLLFIFAGSVTMSSLIVILVSYVFILSAIMKISTVTGQQKTVSTCASHMTTVALYFGTILFMYLRPSSAYSLDQDRVVSVLYTIVTPMLNPFIYSVRNREVKEALCETMRRILFKRKTSRE